MDIHIFELPPIGTNAYLLIDANSKKAVLIDVPLQSFETIQPILKKNNYTLDAVLLTHGHYDHVMGYEPFKKTKIPLLGHKADQQFLDGINLQFKNFNLPEPQLTLSLDQTLTEGTHTILKQKIEIREVPGHSPGSLLFYFKDKKVAFVGDAIFKNSAGRTDLPGGSIEILKKSIREKIYTLPNETILYPGHGPKTTVGDEKQFNYIVRP